MTSKGVVSAATGVGAGLLLTAAYIGAPYAGVRVTPTVITLAAAVAAFGASVALPTLTAISKPEPKKAASQRRLSELKDSDYPHFPRHGLRIVLKPDTVIEELDVVRHPETYLEKEVLLVIKKTNGKAVFNPVIIKKLITTLKGFQNFLHILLVDEHDEYVGYIPAFWARKEMVGGNGETLIVKYIIDVLASPYGQSIFLRDIGGFSIEDTIFDHETLAAALQRVSGGFRGFVVCKHKSLRRPKGVIYEGDLVRLNTPV